MILTVQHMHHTCENTYITGSSREHLVNQEQGANIRIDNKPEPKSAKCSVRNATK